ncbi:MAG: GNAT family N-acetyltransferase [Thermodesulfobacteriota bacterium]
MRQPEFKQGYIPGAIGRIAQLHIDYYHPNWNFGSYFEAKVARDIADFVERFDENRDGLWTVTHEKQIKGAIAMDSIDADTRGTHLRWFIVSRDLQGQGLGNRLMDMAVRFCRDKGYKKIYLWTFAGLNAARHLYEKAGFKLVKERKGRQWGTEVNEQRFELNL